MTNVTMGLGMLAMTWMGCAPTTGAVPEAPAPTAVDAAVMEDTGTPGELLTSVSTVRRAEHRSAPGDSDAGAPMAGLRLERAWWRVRQELRTVVSLVNTTPTPVEVGADRFVLRTRTGLEVPGGAAGLGGCRDGAALLPGERLRCTLAFVFEGEPRTIEHALGPAQLHPCSPAHPLGLCELTSLCVAGACRDQCSRSHQDGVCVDDDEVCDRGACVPPCSEGDPGSGCDEGTCIDGRCELRCRSLALADVECATCFWDAVDAGACGVEERCQDCADCPNSEEPGRRRRTDCECLQRPECGGCEVASRAYWRCVRGACPVCFE